MPKLTLYYDIYDKDEGWYAIAYEVEPTVKNIDAYLMDVAKREGGLKNDDLGVTYKLGYEYGVIETVSVFFDELSEAVIKNEDFVKFLKSYCRSDAYVKWHKEKIGEREN